MTALWTLRGASIASAVLMLATGMACSGGKSDSSVASNPTAPSATTQMSAAPSSASATTTRIPVLGSSQQGIDSMAVSFPPRNEALRFRQELEIYYRDTFRRSAGSSFVDIEGTIVWTQEYLRYRVNGCGHSDAVGRVFAQIDGGTNTATCSSASTPFPPRNEPFSFREALETKYRDGLRRAASATFVDVEGDIVWTQEYLRYRTTGCSDSDATDRVRTQLQGAAPPAGCSTTTTVPTTTTSTTIPQTPLTAVIDGPSGGYCTVYNNCSFSGLRSTGVQTYEWTFAADVPSVTFTSSLAAPTVQFPLNTVARQTQGLVTVRLRVRNAAGQVVETQITVVVIRGNL